MNAPPNPYAPPKAQDAPVESAPPEELVDASHGRRFLNLIIDYVARLLVGVVLGGGLALAGVPLHRYPYLNIFGFTLLTYVGYYLVCESLFGATVGKLITRTRVVDEAGGRPRFMQILGRTLTRFVPFEPFSFFFGSGVLGWHDRWSGTRVVLKR
jgi:uncharacterized RDD family membrane protein YckC